MPVNREGLLAAVRERPALIDQLGIGLSDVIETDERNRVSFQIPTPATDESQMDGRPAHRPFHYVTLRHERRHTAAHTARYPRNLDDDGRYIKPEDAEWETCWYRIQNGWSAGYMSDRAALGAYLNSGEQQTLEVAA